MICLMTCTFRCLLSSAQRSMLGRSSAGIFIQFLSSVRYPTDGLYPGIVDAIDSLRHCYRVTFDRPALGTRSIPDYEVISIDPQETIPLSAYKTQHKASRNLFMSPARLLAQSALQGKRHMHHHKIAHAVGGASNEFGINECPLCQTGDASSTSSTIKSPSIGEMTSGIGGAALALNDPSSSGGRLLLNESDIYGGYPMKFLVMVVRFHSHLITPTNKPLVLIINVFSYRLNYPKFWRLRRCVWMNCRI